MNTFELLSEEADWFAKVDVHTKALRALGASAPKGTEGLKFKSLISEISQLNTRLRSQATGRWGKVTKAGI
jgi:hypothetical protein